MKSKLFLLLPVLLLYMQFSEAALVAVSPQEGEYVSDSSFVAVFTIFRNDRPQEGTWPVKVFFNETEVTSMSEFKGNVVTFTPDKKFLDRPDLAGKHRVIVRLYDDSRNILEEQAVNFTIVAMKAAPKSAVFAVQGETLSSKEETEKAEKKSMSDPLVYTGSVGTDHSYVNTHIEDQYEGELRTSGSGYKGEWFFNHDVSLITSESSNAQTSQRFRVGVGYSRYLRMSLGDNIPLYSPYLLYNTRVRGVELNLQTKHSGINFDFVLGATRRKVEPFIYDEVFLKEAIESSDEFAHNDSVSFFTDGTYSRFLGMGRLHFGSGERVKFGVSFLKSRDDSTSIRQTYTLENGKPSLKGDTPKDNIVLGTDFSLNLWRKKIHLFANGALSVITDNTIDGPLTKADIEDITQTEMDLPLDPGDLASLIIINSSSLPLPSVGGLTNSTAWDVGFRFDTPIQSVRQRLELKYRSIGPNFRTFGNETLEFNKQGFLVTEELGLFNNKVNLRGTVDLYKDNIDKHKPEPTVATLWTAMANVYWDSRYPGGTITFSNNITTNDSPDSTHLDQMTRFNNLDFQLNYSRPLGLTGQNLTLGFNNMNYMMSASALVDANGNRDTMLLITNVATASVTTEYEGLPITTRVGYSQNMSSGNSSVTYYSPSAGLTWEIISAVLKSEFTLQGQRIDFREKGKAPVYLANGRFVTRYEPSAKHSLMFDANVSRKNSNNSIRSGLYYEYYY